MTVPRAPMSAHLQHGYHHGVARPANPEKFRIDHIDAQPMDQAGWLLFSPDTAVPSQIVARFVLGIPACNVELKIVVDNGGQAMVKHMSVWVDASGPATVTSSIARQILVDRLMRAALEKVSQPAERVPGLLPSAFHVAGTPENDVWLSEVPRRGRGRETSQEKIRRAAEVYRAAVASGSRAPIKVVAHELGYSQSQAGRFVSQAREAGLLDQPPPVLRNEPPSYSDDGEPLEVVAKQKIRMAWQPDVLITRSVVEKPKGGEDASESDQDRDED